MSSGQRAKCLQIFNDHFKTNENFLRDTMLLKLRMKGKLSKIRQNLLLKKQKSQSENADGDNEENASSSFSSTSSPLSSPTSSSSSSSQQAVPPVPSFANFADAQAIQHKPTREEKIRDGCLLLRERIQNFKVKMDVMADDGNCQFRAIAAQLYSGDQDGWHAKVREVVVAYMHKQKDEFSFLFEDEKEFNKYLGGMARERTWGDELTLKAASNAYNVNIHVLTSEKEHFYVCYRPDGSSSSSHGGEEGKKNEEPDAALSKKNSGAESQGPIDIFIAYISPIHYNSICLCDDG
jgi:hypothetical protein